MAEEMLKVNEFEHGIDGPYHSHRSFQQLYGPETNYSYRADSAEEILGDTDKLQAMISDHYTVQCPRLAALDDLHEGPGTMGSMMMTAAGLKKSERIIGLLTILPK